MVKKFYQTEAFKKGIGLMAGVLLYKIIMRLFFN
jgi:hypothetical protein